MRLLKLLFGDLTGSRVLSAVFVAWDGVCCVVCCHPNGSLDLQRGWWLWVPCEKEQLPAELSWAWQSRALSVSSLCLAVMAYMQFVEDYSEPQPSMFYQTPQNEHIYQKKNKYLREVYGINDSFISLDPPQDLAPPPALPPKQRQLVSDTSGTPGRASSALPAPVSGRQRWWEDVSWCYLAPWQLVSVVLGILHHVRFCCFLTPHPDHSP